ncbi:MAG: hypothetical protein Q4G50_00395 [Corynebacterium sp.]|uniref:hypothetical protein n=1 Tax=Corynebacterium sp. TaxID=1720 RepID=UPI0026DED7AB|nr:hypothetical protein [Corynebacterium sp.]MDO5668443.1 hypothetical protein [Corynebacterium sp.]
MDGLMVDWEHFAYHRARRAGHDGRLRRLASLSPLIDAPVLTEIIGNHRPEAVGEQIIYRGAVTLRDILYDYDALLLPDPRPEHADQVLEAMAVGLPILGAPAGWLADLVLGPEPCGALGADIPALVKRLAADPELYQRWSAAALGRARQRLARPAPTPPPQVAAAERYPGQERMLQAGGYSPAGSTQPRAASVDSRTRVPSGWTSEASGLAKLANRR